MPLRSRQLQRFSRSAAKGQLYRALHPRAGKGCATGVSLWPAWFVREFLPLGQVCSMEVAVGSLGAQAGPELLCS